MEGLKAKLEAAYKASGGRKVNIISHSMGGLLVSCFISLHKDVRIFSLGYKLNIIKFLRRMLKKMISLFLRRGMTD
jgi:poly(3-hydroxyalkanoate) synthetase